MFKSSIREGPSESIICTPPHDRPVFSLAVGQNTFVTGSADHGLRQYKLDNGKHVRQLFNKNNGHKQWVSTCTITPSGRVLSGAMDSIVCYWQAKSVKCDHFLGHKAPISKVSGDDRIGISASYDATVILWDLRKKDMAQTLLGPHKQAIMDFQWKNSLLATGDKSGVLAFWDLNQCKLTKAVKAHKGAISGIRIHEKQQILITTGLNDGSITGFDMRTNCPIFRKMIHKGSVNDIKLFQGKNYFATCSADGTIKILNLPDFQVATQINANDMIFCLQYSQDVILGGSAKGNVLAYDVFNGQSLFGYGVMKKGGCRNLKFNKNKDRLVCAGQDDSATLLQF